jgi:hypothetical protein
LISCVESWFSALQTDGLLLLSLSSPVRLVSVSETDPQQFFVVEASGTVWTPRFNPMTGLWDTASKSSYVQLIDSERIYSTLVSVVYLSHANMFVWSELEETSKGTASVDQDAQCIDFSDELDLGDVTDQQFFTVYAKKIETVGLQQRSSYVALGFHHILSVTECFLSL